jgi:hypothetical protein
MERGKCKLEAASVGTIRHPIKKRIDKHSERNLDRSLQLKGIEFKFLLVELSMSSLNPIYRYNFLTNFSRRDGPF